MLLQSHLRILSVLLFVKGYRIKLSSYVEAVAASNGQTSSDVLNEAVAQAQSQLKKEEQDVEQYLSDVVQVQVIQHQAKGF